MRIGLLIPTLLHGGAERAICRLSDIFYRSGHEVYLIVFDASNQFYSYSGTLIDLKLPNGCNIFNKLKVFFNRVRETKKIKNELNLDVSISFIAAANFVNVFSKSNEKCIVSQRNFMSKEQSSKIKKSLLTMCFKKADAVVAVSELCRKDLIENFNLNKNKVHTIYNAYDQEEIRGLIDEKIDIEHEEFFDSHKYNIISVARCEYQKGFWNLLKVIYLINKEGINCGLTIVGSGSQLERLKVLAKELKIEKHVQFTGYQKNPYSYVTKSDIFVMSSLFEGFPNALTEGMCCGKAIISTDCPSGPREILEGTNRLNHNAAEVEICNYGILVPCFKSKENWKFNHFDKEHHMMCKAIIEVLKNEKLKLHFEKRSLERSLSFSYDACLKSYEDLIESI